MNVLKDPAFAFREAVLLTGAGFTKDFGGLLSDEMWAWIFNSKEVQERSSVATALRQNQNYENVYSHIAAYFNNGGVADFQAPDLDAITKAVRRAYLEQDRAICRFRGSLNYLKTFLELFAGRTHGERGYFFTLNQDLFVERFCFGNLEMRIPGVPRHMNGVTTGTAATVFNVDDSVQLAVAVDSLADQDVMATSQQFQYVKLHGSVNWFSA